MIVVQREPVAPSFSEKYFTRVRPTPRATTRNRTFRTFCSIGRSSHLVRGADALRLRMVPTRGRLAVPASTGPLADGALYLLAADRVAVPVADVSS